MNLVYSNLDLENIQFGDQLGNDSMRNTSEQTIKQSPLTMVWTAVSVKGTAGLFFLTPETTMNGLKYLELLKNMLSFT